MNVLKFWDTLCNTFGYRFFTGVPNTSLAPLFNTLDPSILHFVPAVNDSTAVDIAAGVSLCGDKATVLCSPQTFDLAAIQINTFIVKNKLPVLFITTKTHSVLDIPTFKLSAGIKSFEQADACIVKQQPTILLCDNLV